MSERSHNPAEDSASDDDSYDSENSESSHSRELGNGKGVAMLSLMSYYGIHDASTAEDIVKNPEAFIDLQQFDSNAYVKVCYINLTMCTHGIN